MSKHRRPLWLIAIIIPFLWLSACESPEQKEARHYERGVELYEAGEDQKAMVEFRNVLQLKPKNADAIYHIGLIHERAGRWSEAYAAYKQAALERSGFIAANVKLGRLALVAGELDAAASAADSIEEAEPGNADGLAIRGAVALRRGDTQAALDLANQALETAPQHQNAVLVLVGVHVRLGDTERALARLDDALAAHPKSTTLRLFRVVLLERLGDVQTAVTEYKKLIALKPESASARLMLADFHLRRDNISDAETVLRTALHDGLAPAQMAERLIRLIYQDKGLDAAITELNELIDRDPDEPALRFLLADLYAIEKRFEDAEATLARIVARVEPGSLANDAQAGMAAARHAAGDKKGARKLIEEVLADDKQHREANLVLGAILLEEGEFDDAIRMARSTLRGEPNWLPGLRLAAEAYLRKGDANLAFDTIHQVVDLDPNDVRYAERLAQLLTERGDYDQALDVWDRVVRLSKDPFPAIRTRAEIEMQRGNFSAAQADIDYLLETPSQELAGALLTGDFFLAQNRFDQSREWFARASDLDPQSTEPVTGMVRSYVVERDLDGALAYLEQRLKEKPDDAIAFNLKGEVLVRQDKLEDAEVAFREAMRLQPDWLTPYYRLGQVFMRDNDPLEAAEVYRAGLQRRPDDPGLLNNLAVAYHKAGKPDGAIATFEASC